jgi:hypothetical protein
LVTRLGVGIADAQRALDRASIKTAKELSNNSMDVIPEITRIINQDGSVSYTTGDKVSIPLLAMGLHPTRYQFSETSIEINLDLRVNEEETTESEEEGRYALWGGTYEVTEERKCKESVEANATVSATIEPVPLPVDLSPSETYTEDDGTDGEETGGD